MSNRAVSKLKLSPAAQGVAGVQWLFFMFANTVVIPISVGIAMHQSNAMITSELRTSFLYTGVACLLQVLFGHRLPLMEGQSGLWWGVILSLAGSATGGSAGMAAIGGGIALGAMLAGVVLALLGGLGLHKLLHKWFTPIVMAVFLFLLASQLCIVFLKGALGLSTGNEIKPGEALLSVGLIVLVGVISLKGKGIISNFAILIGIVIGWIVYVLLFPTGSNVSETAGMLQVFPWGKPTFEVGIVVSGVLTGLLNTTNTVASLRGTETMMEERVSDAQYRRSFVMTGISTAVAGVFGMVPYAPYTSSLGFLRQTRIFERGPFAIGAVLFLLLGCIPALGAFFSTIPVSVGDAVLFVAYLQIFGSALQNLEGLRFSFKSIYRVAGPTLLGLAIMNVPSTAFRTVTPFLQPLLSNGLLVGILLAVLLENLIDWKKFEQTASQAEAEKRNVAMS